MSENSGTVSPEFLSPTLLLEDNSLSSQVSNNYKRDGFTWLSYGLLGYFSYYISILGPVIAFLVLEFGFDYTTSSLHFSAFALGMFLAGAFGERVNQIVGRPLTLWGGTAGMALGAGLLVFSNGAWQSVPSVFLMGLLGSMLLVTVQASLADHHGPQRGLAITEANIIASFGSVLASWVIGLTANTLLGWRAALWLVIPLIVVVMVLFRGLKIPAQTAPVRTKADSTTRPKLPLFFWLYWLIGFLAVSIEWCIGFWSIDFLTKITGLSKSDAALVIGVYFAGTVLSRFVSSRLIRAYRASTLLPVSAAFILAGFPLFWLVPVPLLSLFGLLVVGLGVANLVPLNISAAIGIAPTQPDLASGRLISASGLALLISPFVLGWLADLVGIQQAFTFVMVLAVLMFSLMVAGYLKTNRATGRNY